MILHGTPLNLQYKILTPGTPGFSHHTNQLHGLLDGGISIQGTSFLNKIHINIHTLFNILSIISSRSYNSRIMLSPICRYGLIYLLNLTLTQIINLPSVWDCQHACLLPYSCTLQWYPLTIRKGSGAFDHWGCSILCAWRRDEPTVFIQYSDTHYWRCWTSY